MSSSAPGSPQNGTPHRSRNNDSFNRLFGSPDASTPRRASLTKHGTHIHTSIFYRLHTANNNITHTHIYTYMLLNTEYKAIILHYFNVSLALSFSGVKHNKTLFALPVIVFNSLFTDSFPFSTFCLLFK